MHETRVDLRCAEEGDAVRSGGKFFVGRSGNRLGQRSSVFRPGDDDSYLKDLTFWIVLKGLFWPTRSVLQFDGFDKSLDENFDNAETTIIEAKLSEAGFEQLCRHIGDTHALDASGKPNALGDD